MTLSVLEAVLLTVTAAVVLFAVGRLVGRLVKFCSLFLRRIESINETLSILHDSVKLCDSRFQIGADRIERATVAVTSGVESVPKLIAGLQRVCEAHVIEIGKLREVVTQFSSAVVAPPGAEGDIQHYEEEGADRAFLKETFVADGLSEEAAEVRAKSGFPTSEAE